MSSLQARDTRRRLPHPYWILPILVLAFFTNCHRDKILYSAFAEIGGDGWAYRDSIRFAFSVSDTSRYYDLNLGVVHGKDYAWQNAYVLIRTAFPGDSVKTDVISLELADGAGGWLGSCSGKQCRLTIPLQRRFRFPLSGDYSLTFVQNMRQEVVPGILGLRLSVVEAKK